MRIGTTHGVAVAGIATAMILAPMPAMAAEDADPATGTLTVTRFDDRYADGIFDTSKTAPSGDVDRKNSDFSLRVLAADGTWYYGSANADGDFVFENIPTGSTKVYFTYPNGPGGELLFDATGATSAADIEALPASSVMGTPHAEATVTVDEDGEYLLVGMTALRLVANVAYADGTPASGVAVELGSGSSWYPATEYDFAGGAGTYEAFQPAGYVRHLPGDLKLRLTAPAGYGIASVTAGDNGPFEVTESNGAYVFDSAQVWNYFWNPAFTVTLAELPDTERPQVALVSPTTAGPFQALSVKVDATDNKGLARIVANIYKDGKLVKSTQTAASGATSASHSATVTLPSGDYTVKYNAQDLAGNISQTSTFAVTIDATAPKATVKDGATYTVGANGTYDLVSFKLSDAGKIDKVTINGKVKDLTNNAWSDVNFIKPGTFGAVKGVNTLVVFDVAGNTETTTFTLN